MSFFTFLSPLYLLEITIIVREKNLKKQKYPTCILSMHCIINSMPKNFIHFCENWVLTSSFFGMPLRSHCLIFSPQIMQEVWLTYCSMKIQNYLCNISRFFMSQYPLLLVDSVYVVDTHKNSQDASFFC